MPKGFGNYMLRKNDEIDNVAYDLAVALLRTSWEQTNDDILAWDMQIIAPPLLMRLLMFLKGMAKNIAIPAMMMKCLAFNRGLVTIECVLMQRGKTYEKGGNSKRKGVASFERRATCYDFV